MPDDTERFLNVFMDQNNKCNLRCIMCGFSDPRVRSLPKYDMPFRVFEKIAREVFPRAKYLALSCLTEPLMTRDFSRRLDLLKTYPVPFTEIVTNGTLLTKKIAEKLIEVPVTRIAISIDSAVPETYESIRIGARFKKLMHNIRMLADMKEERKSEMPELRINHVISKVNMDEFRTFLDFVESIHAQAIDVRTVIPFKNARYQDSGDSAFYNGVAVIKEELQGWSLKTGIEDVGYLRYQAETVNLDDGSGEVMTCRRPWDSVAIHANGDVVPCMSWARQPIGNIAEQHFSDLWDGPAYNAIRAEFEEKKPGVDCRHCTVKMREGSEEDDCFFAMLNKKSAATGFFGNGALLQKIFSKVRGKNL
jgi:radical SAM protein with 4Fe4S-binding SPASM domain